MLKRSFVFYRTQHQKPLYLFYLFLQATVVTAREYIMQYFLITKLILDGMKDASTKEELMDKNVGDLTRSLPTNSQSGIEKLTA